MEEREILVVSLGPDDGSLLTLASLNAMRGASRLILRTGRHAAADVLAQEGITFETLDRFYESSEDFEELSERVCRKVIRAAEEAGLCYAVSEPACDATVRMLAEKLPEGWHLRVIGGVSLGVNAACAAMCLGIDTENLRTITALSLDDFRPEADMAMVITEINDRALASEVKLWLSDLYDDEQEICYLSNAAEAVPQAVRIPIYALDRQAVYDHRTAVVVPAVPCTGRKRATFNDLMTVVSRLRGQDGCPWDRQQTHMSLRRYLIEEACEAADALGGDDSEKMADELGDVLLQVALNSRIGAEHRTFTDRDVTSVITAKMIARHPHVFGNVHVGAAEEVHAVWEEAKRRERGEQSIRERMEEVPVTLPALMRAQKVLGRQKMAASSATQWNQLRKIETEPLTEASLGEALECLCILAQNAGLDAETALRTATAKRIELQP